ncbi:hypothetical protein LUZ60_013907 [Juncus effusus]|nr:hypothetical protein LUZ60_013907 [Juncus effusus]
MIVASSILFRLTCLFSLIALITAQTVADSSDVFDVTKYSASCDATADVNSKAFADAWQAACKCAGNTTFLVPEGTFQLGPVKFVGPCTGATPKVQILGTLVAPSDVKAFTDPAWIEFDSVHELVMEGSGVIDGQGQEAWGQDCKDKAISLRLFRVINGKVSNLTFTKSKFFHIAVHKSQMITVENLNISAPCDSKNTDGVHVSGSSDVILNALTIGTGDDCISIGPGSVNITISGVKCGPGHGISIGSLGKYKDEENVANIHVKNCTVTGTSNGLRIKTWPGSPPSEAFNITFEDVALNNVSYPIIIDQSYCPHGHCTTTEPSQVKLRDIFFNHIHGTSNTEAAVTLQCSEVVPCQNVKLQDINLSPFPSFCPNISSICSHVLGAVLGIQSPDPCLGPHVP